MTAAQRQKIPGEEEEFGMKDVPDQGLIGASMPMARDQELIDRITSPRFWEMRRLLVEFGQRRVFFDDVKEGDFVILPDVIRQRDQPWVCCGNRGFTLILSNMTGQMLEIHRADAPLLLQIVSKME